MEKQTLELYHLYQLASQGDVDAQYRLGMRYLSGIGTSQNIRLAYIWIGKAADGNHPQAKQDILHLRTAGIEAAAISAGIPTHIDSHSIVPAPEGYPQKEELLAESMTPITQQTDLTQQQVSALEKALPARPAAPFAHPSKSIEEDSGNGTIKKVFWGIVVLIIVIAGGWFFKGGLNGNHKADENKIVSNKVAILTDKDQKFIAQKVFDERYGTGTYKNGCWAIDNGSCMKFKLVNALPTKGTSFYTLYVYAYDTTNNGRIDAYTVEVDANAPTEYRLLATSTGVMLDPGDGKKTWKFAKDGKNWSIDSRKEHDGIRDTLRSTYSLVGTEIRSSRVLLKSEPIIPENTEEQSDTSDPSLTDKKPEESKKAEGTKSVDAIESLIRQKENNNASNKEKTTHP